eukprot:scaffold46819_cov42-Phaeocystis_antarctica.AAC.2
MCADTGRIALLISGVSSPPAGLTSSDGLQRCVERQLRIQTCFSTTSFELGVSQHPNITCAGSSLSRPSRSPSPPACSPRRPRRSSRPRRRRSCSTNPNPRPTLARSVHCDRGLRTSSLAMISWPTDATNPYPNPDPDPDPNPHQVLVHYAIAVADPYPDPDPNPNPNQVLVHYAIAIGVSLLGVTFVVGHVMEVCTLT